MSFVSNKVHGASPPDISPLESLLTRSVCTVYYTCPVAFWSLLALEHLQGPHHQRHIRCLSGVWSGTTLHRTSVQLSKLSDATHSARHMGQPGRGHRLPQCGQLMIRDELLGYHNNNMYDVGLHQHNNKVKVPCDRYAGKPVY